jgi:uncharacterized heparinase superfamily protein
MRRWLLLLHTVRYLKARQIAYQIYYRIRKPRLRKLPEPRTRGELDCWLGESFLEPATQDGKKFTFLGHTADFEGDWNAPGLPKLWLYNLHYQDDLNAVGAENRDELCAQMVDSWIEGNPPISGNGWEPYCISLRLVNWVKFFSRLPEHKVKDVWLNSLARQADVLEQRLEFHILANHLFANAKALVFVGCYLGGETGNRALRKGLQLLDQEIQEQFLADGAHYERSPMYQGVMLWDLADLMALGHATGLPELKQRFTAWRERFEKGLHWLKAMSHPDGKISFFNDATFGIAPKVEGLERYAGFLALNVGKDSRHSTMFGKLLQPSGYGIIDWPDGHRLLVDVAPVGPDYQPGHAHADSLSCELSLFGQRVLVNSGISKYGDDAERHWQRSTAAHNTVEVDGENSSEIWAGFRVARRAKPFDVNLVSNQGSVLISGSHDGYERLPGNTIHSRDWLATDCALEVIDTLNSTFKKAVAYWHFHPDVSVQTVGKSVFKLQLRHGEFVKIEIVGGKAEIATSYWHLGFGIAKKNTKMLVTFTGPKLITRISWSCT